MKPLDKLDNNEKPLIMVFSIESDFSLDAPIMKAFKGLPLKLTGICGNGNPVKAFQVVYENFVYEMNYGVQIAEVEKEGNKVYALLSEQQDPQELLDQSRGEIANSSIAMAIEEGNYFVVDPRNGVIFSDDWNMLHDIFGTTRLTRVQINSRKHMA